MPELPEVEAVCRKLRRDLRGARIRRARLLRASDPRLERRLRGRRIETVERRGKNVLIRLGRDSVLRVHLRMTGNLYALPAAANLPGTARAWFELADGRALVFDDPRALGRIELLSEAELESLSASLGPEPLSAAFTAAYLRAAAARSRQAIKLFLLDQSKIAGLGNIYAAEALHRAGVHPARPANGLGRKRLERLHGAIVAVLELAVQSACNAYEGPGRYNSAETFPVAVYGREGLPCPECGRRVRRILQAGRSTYYCPGCQR